MKKIILKLVILTSFFGLVGFNSEVNAAETNLVVATEKVAAGYTQYAQNNLKYFLAAHIEQNDWNSDLTAYTLGSGFSLIDGENAEFGTVLYPVFENNKIKAILYVRNTETGYAGTFSDLLAAELQTLLDKYEFSDVAPLVLYEKQGDIFAEVADEIILLKQTSLSEDPVQPLDTQEATDLKAGQPLTVEQTTDLEFNTNVQLSIEEDPLQGHGISISKYEIIINPWKVAHTQGEDEWCSAYAAANILSNKMDARPTTYRDIVDYYNKTPDQALSNNEIIQYANSRGVYPYFLNRVLTFDEVQNEISKGNAIFGGWHGAGDYINRRHSIVIIGTYYEHDLSGFKAYWVHNPWYTYNQLIDASQPEVTLNVPGGSFTWDNTITNW